MTQCCLDQGSLGAAPSVARLLFCCRRLHWLYVLGLMVSYRMKFGLIKRFHEVYQLMDKLISVLKCCLAEFLHRQRFKTEVT